MKDLLRDVSPGEVVRALFGDTGEMDHTSQAPARALSDGLREYRTHRRFGFPHISQRIAALRKLKLALLRMRGDSHLDEPVWEGLKGQLNLEFELLNKLLRHHKKRDPQFQDLYDHLPLTMGEAPRSVRSIESGRVQSSLRGKYILERLDPLHRDRNEEMSLKLVHGFRRWIGSEEMPGALRSEDLWTQLVGYFLYRHDRNPSQARESQVCASYHGDKQSFFSTLEFDGQVLSTIGSSGRRTARMVSRALAYYAFVPAVSGPTEYHPYDYSTYGRTRFPYQAPLHTVSKVRRGTYGDGQGWTGSVVYPENKQAPGRTFNLEAPQIGWSMLYTMVGGTFHVAPQSEYHSYAASGRNVQSAGMIAADNGKIVAIDNSSGHYAPNWRQLRQAVHVILNAGAFSRNALVGTLYAFSDGQGVNAALLPVMDFIRLCSVMNSRRHRDQTWRSITSSLPDVPTMDRERGGVLNLYGRVWTSRSLTWDQVGKELFRHVDATS